MHDLENYSKPLLLIVEDKSLVADVIGHTAFIAKPFALRELLGKSEEVCAPCLSP